MVIGCSDKGEIQQNSSKESASPQNNLISSAEDSVVFSSHKLIKVTDSIIAMHKNFKGRHAHNSIVEHAHQDPGKLTKLFIKQAEEKDERIERMKRIQAAMERRARQQEKKGLGQ